MENLLDSWDRAQRAPEPVELAKRTGGQVAVDAVTGREEFAKSGEMIREGLSLGEPEKRDLGQLAGGLALGGLTGLSFVAPWGRAGRMTAGGLRVAGRELGQFAAGEVLESVPAVVSKSGKRLSDSLARGMADEINDTFARSGVSVASRDAVGGIFESLGELGRGGGFTYTPATGVSDYSAGYGVAVGKGYTAVVPLDEFDATDVVTYLSYRPTGTRFSVAELVADNPKNSLGAWIEPFEGVDHVWLDVSRVLASEEDALRVGGALNEIAIIDFAAAKRTNFGDGTYIDVGADYKPGGRLYDPSVVRDVSMPSPLSGPARAARELPPGQVSGESTASDLPLPSSLLRDEGSYWADLPGTRVRELAEELVQRHVGSPQGISALEPGEIAAVIEGLPEFSDFVRMYRATVLNKMRDPLDRRSMQAGELMDFAGMAGLAPPPWARGLDTSVSFPASVKGDLPEALRNGAANLAVRVRNMNTFSNDDAYRPTFYVEFNRVLRAVEAETGMPIEVLTSALASASSQAAPYDEVLRFARVAPMVRVREGVAETVPGALELLGSDRMAVTALRGLVDSINNPDFLTVKPSGQAMKTSAYAYNRLDPMYMPVYVADTVDGVGQFLISGGDAGTSKAEKSIINQIAGRTLANIYDVPNPAMQEATWGHIRLVRDGLKTTLTGKPTATAIAPSFTGSKGHVEDVLVAAVERMDKNVVQLARQNREKFYGQVKEGNVVAWNWDVSQRRPVISSSDYLIPADQRPVASGRAMLLQNQMMALVEALGPNLRSRIVALALAIGVPAGVLAAALGSAGTDVGKELGADA